ncbi:cap-G [Culex quinquefasciatus]|uniref:Cap-G n=1 Tax=Culex quinquefasciatus TaxID=7176 RepID=B0WJL7_CULQU|nr:cap-G [Culex quinquefasciatus]|eukprot:XP_001848901.1 cap-G [Culex quinquefasciatus]
MPPRKRKIKVVATSPEKPRFNFELIETVLNGQKDEKNHPNLIKKLKELYQKMPHDTFMRSFIQSLKAPMCLEEGNPFANNRLKLCATFIADPIYCEQEEPHPLIMAIFDFLLSTISQNAIFRFRICQFVNMVLNAMGPEASLDDDICDRILKYHLERMRDVTPSVRVQAVLALQRLQDPEDPEDDVFRIYIFHMESDVSPIVRQAVITSLGRNYRTIPYILERLWDVDERVRRHTYIQMSSYPVKQYKVAQRLTFLEQGLNDHSDKVQRVVKNVLIPQWFESYQKNYVAFVKALKIDADEKEMERFAKTAKLALGEIFAKYGINDATTMLGLREEDKTIPLENLTIETAICWQALLEFLQHTESDELDAYMVDLTAFCNYIKTFADTPTQCNYIRQLADDPSMTTDKLQKMYFQSMMQVLLEIVASYDLGDEVGRENLKKVLAEMLACGDLGEGNVKTIMTIFERLVGDVEERFRFCVDLINGILEPSRADVSNSSRSLVDEYLEKNPDKSLQMKISSLRLNIMDLKEQEMDKVNKKDYGGAQRVSDELTAANDEYAALLKPILMKVSSAGDGSIFGESMLKPKKITNSTINKCLQILYYLVNSSSVKSLTPIVCELNKTFISRYVESSVIDTRDWALKCSITFSMLYDGLSKDTFQLLYQQFFRNHCTRIWETSISGIFELLDRYGFEHFDVESKKDESRKNSRQLFNTRDYLDQDDEGNSSNTGSGVDLMKMMTHFFETCEDSVICMAIVDGFCRMIVRGHYTSPDIMAKLLLKYFNPTTEPKMQQILSIFHESLIKKKRQEILQKALLTTLFTILEAPNENPLHEVKPDHVLRFVINSTKPVFCSPGLNPHNTIAMSFLEVMKDNLTYKDLLKLLSKELLTLEISDDQMLKNDLITCTTQICEEPTLDPKILKNLNDFKQILQGTYREPLTFSSTRAPPLAAEDQEAEQQNSDAEEAPEVAEEEPSTPRESIIPLINKSSLDKDNEPPPKSPAKAPNTAAATPVSPVTPTTFGSGNTSGMRSLRKSMNFAPPTEKSTPKDIFKVPDANATKKLRAQQQKKAAADKAPEPTPTPEPDSPPPAEESAPGESPLEASSFAIPSTQDTSVADSSLDGDRSILHLEIPETQQAPEDREPEQEPEVESSPEVVVKRTPTKRKPAAKSSSEEAVSASSDESSPASSRKRLDGSLEEVGPSPNATISRFDRSVVRPLVKASAKALVEASKGTTPVALPRTRGVARNETINSKVQTRKSLTEITSKKGSTSLTGIEPLSRSPTRKEPSPTRKKEVASKSAPKKAPEVAKPAQKKTPEASKEKKSPEPSKKKEVEKPATVSTRTTRTSIEPPKSAKTAMERRKIYAANLKSKTDSKSKKSTEEPTTTKKDSTPPVQKRTATRRTLEKSPAVSSPSTRSSRATTTSEKLSPPAKKPSPSGEAATTGSGGGVTMRKGVRGRGKTSSSTTTDSPAAKSSTSGTSLSSSSSGSLSRGNRTPSSRRSLRSSKGSTS